MLAAVADRRALRPRLARPVLALALGPGHRPVGREGAFLSAAAVPGAIDPPRRSAVLGPYVFAGSSADRRSAVADLLAAASAPRAARRRSELSRRGRGRASACSGSAAMALMLLFRDRGWHPVGAVAAALAFAFGASAAWRIQHVGQMLSLSYWPIALWLLLRALERGSLGLRADGRRRRRADGARARPGRLSRPLAAGRRRALAWAAAPLRRAAIRRSLRAARPRRRSPAALVVVGPGLS